VKANVVTALEILGQDASDCAQLPALVKQTAQSGFTVQEVPADKAYLSRDNLALVEGLGGTAFVPFKSNSVQGEAGSLWERMWLYYQFRREEFLKHDHARSNAESTCSMVKAKFRDHVRSRTPAAMTNEVPRKFLCHNLCVLIQGQCELGIEPDFWQTEDKGEASADVLPLVRPGSSDRGCVMRMLAAAVVVLAGALVFAVALIAGAMVYAADRPSGSISGSLAVDFGRAFGVLLTVFGCVLVCLELRPFSRHQRGDSNGPQHDSGA
jgi:hypothetical protein